MREFVGVKSFLDFLVSTNLKRDALTFNYIAIPDVNRYLSAIDKLPADITSRLPLGSPQFLVELNNLHEKGIIRDLTESTFSQQISDDEYKDVLASENEIREKLRKFAPQASKLKLEPGDFLKDPEKTIEALQPAILQLIAEAFRTRRLSIQLRSLSEVDAYPISALNGFTVSVQGSRKADVVHIAFNALPIPDDSTPWEQIMEYRSDPDSRSKFLALRHWMSEVARAELTPAAVEEKLEYLIDQYQKHMKLHRMKTNVGTLETIVTTGAEILGDLASFKWGKAAEALFSLKRRNIALLEGELTAPGNEVAYIVKTRETFTGKRPEARP